MITHPMLASSALAKVLESDPIVTAQIKEHIPVIRLLQLLNVTEEELIKAMNLPTGETED